MNNLAATIAEERPQTGTAGADSLHRLVRPLSGWATIVADPPWEYPDGFTKQSRTPGKWKAKEERYYLAYPTLTVEEVCAMPIATLAADNCRLWLWATNRYLPDAFAVMRAWGFDYRQTLTWRKTDGNMGGSIAPNSEFLLVGVRGQPERKTRLKASVWDAPQSKRHSEKPALFMDIIESVSPAPYLELFARNRRLGWEAWGNEV